MGFLHIFVCTWAVLIALALFVAAHFALGLVVLHYTDSPTLAFATFIITLVADLTTVLVWATDPDCGD